VRWSYRRQHSMGYPQIVVFSPASVDIAAGCG
jgi:hypothetical protein